MEEKYEYQAQWLRLKGMHREIKMMCLGGNVLRRIKKED
jgi:hypothetical protein